MSNARVAPERRACKLQRLEERASDSCEGIQALETLNGVEVLLDHARYGVKQVAWMDFFPLNFANHPAHIVFSFVAHRQLDEERQS